MKDINQQMKDAERYRQNPIYKTDFSKPLSEIIEGLRQQMVQTRCQIHDIGYGYPNWKERVEHVRGLLTCGIVALAYSKEEIMQYERQQEDELNGKSLAFSVRGIGLDSCPGCYVCQATKRHPESNSFLNNISAFVKTKEEGEEIVSWFKDKGAWLDYREHEPNRIQLKVGACNFHLPNLKKLEHLCRAGFIREKYIETSKANQDTTNSV